MDKDIKVKEAVKKTMEENKELLERLNDYNADGVAYWEDQIHD
jgi:hypothetical protein